MEKLFIPKGCKITGEQITLRNDGDVVVENDLIPAGIVSEHGDIRFAPTVSEDVYCGQISAPNGLVELEGGGFDVPELEAKNVIIKARSLSLGEQVAVTDDLQIDGEKLSGHNLSAGSMHLQCGEIHMNDLTSRDEVVLEFDKAQFGVIRARRIVVKNAGSLECNKLFAEEEIIIEGGTLAVKFIKSPRFIADPSVTGIAIVADCEEVKAEGVRGFIKPSELDVFKGGAGLLDMADTTPAGRLEQPADSDEDDSLDTAPDLDEMAPAVDQAAYEAEAEDDTESEPEITPEEIEPETEAESPYHIQTIPVPEMEDDDSMDGEEAQADEADEGSNENGLSASDEVDETETATDGADEEPMTPPTFETQDMSAFSGGFQTVDMSQEPPPVEEVEADAEESSLETPPAFDWQTENTDDELDEPAIPAEYKTASGMEEPAELSSDDLDDASYDELDEVDDVEEADVEDLTEADELEVDEITSEDLEDMAEELEDEDEASLEGVEQLLDEVDPDEVDADDLAEAETDEDDLDAFSGFAVPEPDEGDDDGWSEEPYSLDTPTTDASDADLSDAAIGVPEPPPYEPDFSAPPSLDFQDSPGPNDSDEYQWLDQSIKLDQNVAAEAMAHSAHDSDNTADFDAPASPPRNEDDLAIELNEILDKIRACFPTENYPKFIGQVNRYIDERRFSILAKARNQEAVLSSFDKLNHQKVSSLARELYDKINTFFN